MHTSTRLPLLLLAATALASAQSPLAISNELASRTGESEFAPDGEWTATAAYTQGIMEYSLENVLAVPLLESPTDAVFGEITLGATAGLHDFFALGASATLSYLDAGTTTTLAVTASPAWGSEALGLDIADDNEVAYNIDDDTFAYTNTLLVDWTLRSQGECTLLAEFENEATKTTEVGSKWEDALNAGPVLNYGPYSVGLFYSPVVLPDVEHGAKISLGHSF